MTEPLKTKALGLPDGIRGCLFDLDGVLTQTAAQHAAAWKQTFDGFLAERATATGEPFVPFDDGDYTKYVDGKPRLDGTRSFLASRRIELPEGSAADPPGGPSTVQGLSSRKNALVLELIRTQGVDVYEGSVRYLHAVRAAGLRSAVVSSSANAAQVLEVSGLAGLIDVRVDAIVARERGLPGKPAPDTFLAGAQLLGLSPAECAVFEDALAGVEAGRAGGFGIVVGVDRVGQAAQLRAHGADVVVTDLAELLEG